MQRSPAPSLSLIEPPAGSTMVSLEPLTIVPPVVLTQLQDSYLEFAEPVTEYFSDWDNHELI